MNSQLRLIALNGQDEWRYLIRAFSHHGPDDGEMAMSQTQPKERLTRHHPPPPLHSPPPGLSAGTGSYETLSRDWRMTRGAGVDVGGGGDGGRERGEYRCLTDFAPHWRSALSS